MATQLKPPKWGKKNKGFGGGYKKRRKRRSGINQPFPPGERTFEGIERSPISDEEKQRDIHLHEALLGEGRGLDNENISPKVKARWTRILGERIIRKGKV